MLRSISTSSVARVVAVASHRADSQLASVDKIEPEEITGAWTYPEGGTPTRRRPVLAGGSRRELTLSECTLKAPHDEKIAAGSSSMCSSGDSLSLLKPSC